MTTASAPTAGRKEWLGLGILALPTLLVALDVFVLLLALPHLSADLGANSSEQLWIMDIYGFMVAGFLVTMGTLGDRIGRRRLLLIGAAAFGAASLMAAFSTSPFMLIAARVLLGIAGATLTPSTLSLITTIFKDAKQRAVAVSLWASCFTLGAIIGPMLGGIMLEYFWWGSLFLLGVPVMVLLLITGPKLLPEYKDENAGRLDLPSVALNLGTVIPVIYGIKELARTGWEPVPIVVLLAGLVMGVLFVQRQRTLENPLLDLRLFAHARFSAALLSLLAYSLIGGTVMLFLTQYYQAAQGMSAFRAGLGLLPGMAAATVSFMICPIIARKIRPAYVIGAGIAGVILALLAFAQVDPDSGTPVLVIGFAVFSFCGAPVVALGTNLVVGTVPPEKAGSAGGLSQISNEFGAALGVATLGTLGLAVYRDQIDGSVPDGLAEGSADAARDSIAGAAAVSEDLSDGLAEALMAPAREAFTTGLHTVAIVAAVLIAAAGIFFVALLRDIPPIGQEEGGQPEGGGEGGPEGGAGTAGEAGDEDASPESAAGSAEEPSRAP